MVPPFNERPEVIIWGDRIFQFRQLVSPVNFSHKAYAEVFAYAIPPGGEVNADGKKAGPGKEPAATGEPNA